MGPFNLYSTNKSSLHLGKHLLIQEFELMSFRGGEKERSNRKIVTTVMRNTFNVLSIIRRKGIIQQTNYMEDYDQSPVKLFLYTLKSTDVDLVFSK